MNQCFDYNLYSQKKKIGTQHIVLQKENIIHTLKMISNLESLGLQEKVELKMDDKTYSPLFIDAKREFKSNRDDIVVEYCGSVIKMRSKDEKIYFSGKVYENIQLLFMLPYIYDIDKASDMGFKYINILSHHAKDINCVAIKNTDRNIAFESVTPVKYFSYYNSEDGMLDYYCDNQQALEIIRN